MQIPDIAVGAVLAATITGVISLLGLTIAKEMKVSEFRQTWIDALRADLASLVASVHAISDALDATKLNAVTYSGPLEIWKAVRDDWNSANRTITAIRLRVNPNESQDLLDILKSLEAEFLPGKQIEKERLRKLETSLVDTAQKLLKTEWKVVRDGEPVYRLTKSIVLIIVLAGLFVCGILVFYRSGG